MLEFSVGPFVYRANLHPGLIDLDGRACFGICDHQEQQILVADTMQPAMRMLTLFHELRHAWHHHFPFNICDEEGDADSFGIVGLSLVIDFIRQRRRIKAFCTMHVAVPGWSIEIITFPGDLARFLNRRESC